MFNIRVYDQLMSTLTILCACVWWTGCSVLLLWGSYYPKFL